MKITDAKSHVLQYPLDKELGYSQGFFDRRTAHIVEVFNDEGIRGVGEAFGGGQAALANHDMTPNRFREELLVKPLAIPEQVKKNGGWVSLPSGTGLGIEIDLNFMKRLEVTCAGVIPRPNELKIY